MLPIWKFHQGVPTPFIWKVYYFQMKDGNDTLLVWKYKQSENAEDGVPGSRDSILAYIDAKIKEQQAVGLNAVFGGEG